MDDRELEQRFTALQQIMEDIRDSIEEMRNMEHEETLATFYEAEIANPQGKLNHLEIDEKVADFFKPLLEDKEEDIAPTTEEMQEYKQ